MTNAAFPTPEEMVEMLADTAEDRTRIALTVQEATMVLIVIATMEHVAPGCDQSECESCNAKNALFWTISNALPIYARVAYQRALRETGIELPPSPWEVVASR